MAHIHRIAATLLALACAPAAFACAGPPAPSHTPVRLPQPDSPVALSYAIRGLDGSWTWDIAVSANRVAQRRTRTDGLSYTFGSDSGGAWVQVGGRPPVAVSSTWGESARTSASMFDLQFLKAAPGDALELISRRFRTEDYAYHTPGGEVVQLTVDRRDGSLRSFDMIDSYRRLTLCDKIAWTDLGGRRVLSSAKCVGIVHEAGSATTWLDLRSAHAGDLPEWANPGPRAAAQDWHGTDQFPFDPRQSPRVAVRVADSAPLPFILDTGAWMTLLTGEAARQLGVMPTGETPHYSRPPWLREGVQWVGLADRLRVGNIERTGVRVLVQEDNPGLGDASGLVGLDFLSNYVIDLDSPNRVVRVHSRDTFRPSPSMAPVPLLGDATRRFNLPGAVDDVTEGAIILDSGAALDVVVHAAGVRLRHPRTAGSEVSLSSGESTDSPDYATQIESLTLGPFGFPAMDCFARDRRQERMGGGIALVGMGLLHHLRVVVDAGAQRAYLSPGDSYRVLVRAGLELDDGDTGPIVTRVVPGSAADRGGFRTWDVIRLIECAPGGNADQVRRQLARAPGFVRVEVQREGYSRSMDLRMQADR